MASRKLKPGDEVEWNTPQGKTEGEVKKVVESRTKVGGTELKGSKDDPVFIVESAKSGKQAGHKAGGLKRKA